MELAAARDAVVMFKVESETVAPIGSDSSALLLLSSSGVVTEPQLAHQSIEIYINLGSAVDV